MIVKLHVNKKDHSDRILEFIIENDDLLELFNGCGVIGNMENEFLEGMQIEMRLHENVKTGARRVSRELFDKLEGMAEKEGEIEH